MLFESFPFCRVSILYDHTTRLVYIIAGLCRCLLMLLFRIAYSSGVFDYPCGSLAVEQVATFVVFGVRLAREFTTCFHPCCQMDVNSSICYTWKLFLVRSWLLQAKIVTGAELLGPCAPLDLIVRSLAARSGSGSPCRGIGMT
jgi:hypothetical protein